MHQLHSKTCEERQIIEKPSIAPVTSSFLVAHYNPMLSKPITFLSGSWMYELNSFPLYTRLSSSDLLMIPHLTAIDVAVIILSPVTIRTVIPAL